MASLPFLPQTIHFSTGDSFERLQPITDFRQCHGAIPHESRVLYRCKRLTPKSSSTTKATEEEYVLKVKVQIPDPTVATTITNTNSNENNSNENNSNDTSTTPPPTPSNTTTHEAHALQIFRNAQSSSGPNLIASETFAQPSDGLLPGGYISYTVMTLVPGRSLYELGYWSLAPEKREEIQERFVETLRSVRSLGIEPLDKGLRNVMYDTESGKCGLVDFELWQESSHSNSEVEVEESNNELLQKWGLAHKPPAKNWWAEFGIVTC